VSDRRALTTLAEAGLRSAGCIAGDMTPTVNAETDQGQGGRIDHILLSPALAGTVVPGSYQVHASDTGNQASDHRMVSVRLDLTQVRFPTMRAGR
jgi:endonuclease/exonuclease/phosphatase family metal-dependent hydrolase